MEAKLKRDEGVDASLYLCRKGEFQVLTALNKDFCAKRIDFENTNVTVGKDEGGPRINVTNRNRPDQSEKLMRNRKWGRGRIRKQRNVPSSHGLRDRILTSSAP